VTRACTRFTINRFGAKRLELHTVLLGDLLLPDLSVPCQILIREMMSHATLRKVLMVVSYSVLILT